MSAKSPALAGVIGWPIGHSKSPQLQGHWLQRYKIAGHYIPIALHPEDFERGLRSLPLLGFKGVNITIPHKETAYLLADEHSSRAKEIGAANTLVFDAEGRILADNTDGYGFISNLKQTVSDWQPESGAALVLGAGGAARGVISALNEAGVPSVLVSNRTRERADRLAEDFCDQVSTIDWNERAEAVGNANLIVNTTSIGLDDDQVSPIELSNAAPGIVAADIVYRNGGTAFLRDAQQRGLVLVDGIGMLMHQAVPGFEAWFGVHPEVDDELRSAVLGNG